MNVLLCISPWAPALSREKLFPAICQRVVGAILTFGYWCMPEVSARQLLWSTSVQQASTMKVMQVTLELLTAPSLAELLGCLMLPSYFGMVDVAIAGFWGKHCCLECKQLNCLVSCFDSVLLAYQE